MTKPLRLFTSPSAFPNPQRVRLFMLEKGIESHIEESIFNMAPGGEQRNWPHLKMNPWGEFISRDMGADKLDADSKDMITSSYLKRTSSSLKSYRNEFFDVLTAYGK